MKAVLGFLLAFSLVVACTTARKRQAVASGVGVPSAKSLAEETRDFQALVEISLTYRAGMLRVAARLSEKTDGPLSGRDLEVLRSGTRAYLDLRAALYDVAQRYEGAVDDQRYDDSSLRLKSISLSLASALVLYDNYLSAITIFEEDARLRRLINDPDSGFGIDANMLDQLSASASSIGKRQRVRSAMAYVESERKRLEHTPGGRALARDAQYLYLAQLIDQSPCYAFVRKLQVGAISSRHFEFFGALSADFVAEMRNDGVNLVSLVFGNAMGLYESRKGKLHGDKVVSGQIAGELRPLDILLEKTPFRLTDNFIPGHFGHVAIWLGDEVQLREFGVWDHPLVVPYHDRLKPSDSGGPKSGALVLEALRSGVQLNTLSHFMNVDDVAILRPVGVQADPAATKEALLLAFRQIGKAYDFNFDVNTTEKIVCSELAYVTFPTIQWPTESTLGRDTISPDQVARLAWESDEIELVLFYHDGMLVPAESALKKAQALVGGEQ